MKYRNWACEVPDLDPRGFRPVAGKMRLYGGDGGGGGGDAGAAEAASLGFDIGTPGTSTGPGSGEVSAADIEAAVDDAVEASAKSTPAAITESTAPGLSNVVGSANQPGGWMTGSGTGLVSQGMNISLGLDPMHGAIGPYAGANPSAPNQTAIDTAATILGVTPQDLIESSARDYGFLGESKPDLSVSGLDRGTLEALSSAGYGELDITDNQTVNQALAAFNTRDAMDKAFPGLANALVPGFGTLSSVSKALVGLHQGYLTPGQALAQIGLGLAGIPSGLVDKSITGPSLESVGMVTPSTEPLGTAGGDSGGGAAPTTTTTSTASPSTSVASAGLPALFIGSSGDDEDEKEAQNIANVQRGIAMTPYGLPYGG